MDPFNDGTILPEANAIKTVVETIRYPVNFTKRSGLSESTLGRATIPLVSVDLEIGSEAG
jgi:hypothetical protein